MNMTEPGDLEPVEPHEPFAENDPVTDAEREEPGLLDDDDDDTIDDDDVENLDGDEF
jgi:hypothetical protein